MKKTLTMTELKTKADRVQWVMDELESLYPETPVPLDHTDAYTLLVAVLLSAQCTDAGSTPSPLPCLNLPTTRVT